MLIAHKYVFLRVYKVGDPVHRKNLVKFVPARIYTRELKTSLPAGSVNLFLQFIFLSKACARWRCVRIPALFMNLRRKIVHFIGFIFE